MNFDLTTIAMKSRLGKVVLTDTSTRRQQSIEPPEDFFERTKGKFSIGWTPANRLKVWSSEYATALNRDVSGANGKFITIPVESQMKLPPAIGYELTDLNLTDSDELQVFCWKYPSQDETTVGNRAFSSSINLADNSIDQYVSFTNLNWPESDWSHGYFQKGSSTRKVSPNGRFALTWGKSTFKGAAHDSRNLKVIDLENPDRILPIMNLERISETVWTSDGSLLIVRGRERSRTGTRDVSKIVDLNKWDERVVEGLPLKSSSRFREWNDGFVCMAEKLGGAQDGLKWNVAYFACKEGSKLNVAEGDFGSVQFLKLNGPNVIFKVQRLKAEPSDLARNLLVELSQT